MDLLVSWKNRPGASTEENEASAKRGLQLFSKWSPPEGAVFKQFLTRLDGDGGYALVSADDPKLILDSSVKFGPMFEFSVVPVMDIMEAVPVFNEAIEWWESIS